MVDQSVDTLWLDKYQAEAVEKCPICAGDGRFIMTAPGDIDILTELDVYDCTRCGSTYTSPRMTREAMDRYYRSGGYRFQITNAEDSFGERRRALMRTAMFAQFMNFKSPKRVLDVGCARGYLLQRIKDWSRDVETVGYDLFRYEDRVHFVLRDKSEITGTFDFITCIHVLEHTYDPLGELEWMWSLLDDGGILVLELPTMRKIVLEHPVTFTLEAAQYLARHVGSDNYTIVNAPESGFCIVFIAKG